MENKILYHGSAKNIQGKLIPNLAEDLGGVKENSQNGIYATHIKKSAKIMAILGTINSDAGLIEGSKSPIGIVYSDEMPSQEEAYVYHLPIKSFENSPRGSWQWVSKEPVMPIKKETINVKDNLHLIRKATKKEMEKYKGLKI